MSLDSQLLRRLREDHLSLGVQDQHGPLTEALSKKSSSKLPNY